MIPDIICRYVPIPDVPEWIAWGWIPYSKPLRAPHGCDACLLTWGGDGEPNEPAEPQVKLISEFGKRKR
jgi:hypothetical protein